MWRVLLLLAAGVILCSTTEQAPVNHRDPRHRTGDKDCEACDTDECVTTAGRILKSLDRDIDPCDDFYQFACGGWIKEQILPPHRSSVQTLDDVDQHLAAVRNLLAETPKPSDLDSVKKAKIMYSSCLQYAKGPKDDSSLIAAIKSRFGKWPLADEDWDEDQFSLEDFLVEANRLQVYPLVKLRVEATPFITTGGMAYQLWARGPELGLPISSYVDIKEDTKTLQLYEDKIFSDAHKFGIDNNETALKDIKEIVEVETKLAQIFQSQVEKAEIITLGGLKTHLNQTDEHQENLGLANRNLDYVAYVKRLTSLPQVGVTDVTDENLLLVVYPDPFVEVLKYFSVLPRRTQANYIIWRVLDSLQNALVLKDVKLTNLLNEVVYGTTATPSAEESCVIFVSKTFELVVHRLLYADKFPPEEKRSADLLLRNIKTEFDVLLSEHDWVDEKTAQIITEKNTALTTTMLYYEQAMNDSLLDIVYANITVNNTDFTETILAAREETVYRNLRFLRQPYKGTLSELPHEVVAQNVIGDNKIEFTSIIFEPPVYTANIPASINYGGMGVVVAHEIVHAFDNTGYSFNEKGQHGQWWSNETVASFMQRQHCMIDQYDNFFYETAGKYVNGTLTLGENIADNAGIKMAYRAYRKFIRDLGQEEKRLPGLDFTNDQLFFINFAQIWCTVQNEKAAEITILRDGHSPGRFRTIGTLQNSEEFSQVFQCPVGSNMNPETKCAVW